MTETTTVPDTFADVDVQKLMGGRPLERIVYSAEEIAEQVARIGEEITRAYEGEADLLILGLLKGSFIFLGDLVRRISRPLQVDFLVASSRTSWTAATP
jgi:hypoxanthine-guanine phosphoribosyltransferase